MISKQSGYCWAVLRTKRYVALARLVQFYVLLGSPNAPTIAQNWLNLNAERGLSAFDQRHLLNAQLQYTTGMGMAAKRC